MTKMRCRIWGHRWTIQTTVDAETQVRMCEVCGDIEQPDYDGREQ
jgi:hypothetical protein